MSSKVSTPSTPAVSNSRSAGFFCNTVPAFGAASKVYTPPRMSLDAIRVQTFSYA